MEAVLGVLELRAQRQPFSGEFLQLGLQRRRIVRQTARLDLEPVATLRPHLLLLHFHTEREEQIACQPQGPDSS